MRNSLPPGRLSSWFELHASKLPALSIRKLISPQSSTVYDIYMEATHGYENRMCSFLKCISVYLCPVNSERARKTETKSCHEQVRSNRDRQIRGKVAPSLETSRTAQHRILRSCAAERKEESQVKFMLLLPSSPFDALLLSLFLSLTIFLPLFRTMSRKMTRTS